MSNLDELREKIQQLLKYGVAPTPDNATEQGGSYLDSLMSFISQYLEQETQVLKAQIKFLEDRHRMERNKYELLAESVSQETLKARIDELERLQMQSIYIEKVHEKLDRVVLTRRNQLVSQLTTNKSKDK